MMARSTAVCGLLMAVVISLSTGNYYYTTAFGRFFNDALNDDKKTILPTTLYSR